MAYKCGSNLQLSELLPFMIKPLHAAGFIVVLLLLLSVITCLGAAGSINNTKQD